MTKIIVDYLPTPINNVVQLENAKYKFSRPIVLPDNLTIQGAGYSLTKLVYINIQ